MRLVQLVSNVQLEDLTDAFLHAARDLRLTELEGVFYERDTLYPTLRNASRFPVANLERVRQLMRDGTGTSARQYAALADALLLWTSVFPEHQLEALRRTEGEPLITIRDRAYAMLGTLYRDAAAETARLYTAEEAKQAQLGSLLHRAVLSKDEQQQFLLEQVTQLQEEHKTRAQWLTRQYRTLAQDPRRYVQCMRLAVHYAWDTDHILRVDGVITN